MLSPIMGETRLNDGEVEAALPIGKIKQAFAEAAMLNRSFVSKQGADNIDMDDTAVVAIIQALTISDFDKSMTSRADHKVWQDVYKHKVCNRTIYVKFTLDIRGSLFLISFKQA